MKTANDSPVQLTGPGEVRLVRSLPGPIERVWAYLTEPDKRATWLARGPFEAKAGGKIRLEFHNSKLSVPGEKIPEKYAADCQDGCNFTGRVTRCEPPRVLVHTWGEADGSESEVTFELTPDGGRVRFMITHRRLGDNRAVLTSVCAGWHTHVAILIARLEGAATPSFWSTHTRLEAEYEQRLPASATV
jgi:uncharacterized protein YndB with AHSA1/START domain